MKIKLEEFIKANKSDFDDQIPDLEVWDKIENRLEKSEHKKIIHIWASRIAALFVMVLCCGIVLGILIGKNNSSELNYANSPELKKYKETEYYYDHQVNMKLNQVKDLQVKTTVEADLKQLDEIYEELKQEIIKSNYTNSNVLINAMIRNHKTKVEILESILEKQNQTKDEKISI